MPEQSHSAETPATPPAIVPEIVSPIPEIPAKCEYLRPYADRIGAAGRQTLTGIVELGCALAEARKAAKRGHWGPFRDALGISERSAQHWMQAARIAHDEPKRLQDARTLNGLLYGADAKGRKVRTLGARAGARPRQGGRRADGVGGAHAGERGRETDSGISTVCCPHCGGTGRIPAPADEQEAA